MWLKLALALCVIAFCTFLGYLTGEKYRKRRAFFRDFSDFNEKYLAELRYSKRPLKELAATLPAGDLASAVRAVAGGGEGEVKHSYLSGEEKRDCGGYLSALGRGDARTQIGYLEGRSAALAAKKEACAKEAKERGELGLKLGLLAGLAVVILIV